MFRVEDHDDLTPIFNRQTDVLTDSYGAYYLAELIESQDEEMKCIVAEVSELTNVYGTFEFFWIAAN